MRNKVQLVASVDTAVDARIRVIAASGGSISAFVNDALKQALLIHDDADTGDKESL